MKKLVAVLICTIGMISSTFAMGFGAGVRGFLGKDFDECSTFAEVGGTLKSIDTSTDLNFGFGGYTYLYLLGGLGVQAELNVTRGQTTLKTPTVSKDLEIWTLDIPLMVWLNQDIGPFSIGIGAGPNFAFALQQDNLKSMYKQTKSNAEENLFTVGACFGLDLKLYFNEHIGLVLGARYVTDFSKKDVPVTVSGYDTGSTYPTISVGRKALYGNLGVEFRLF